MQRALILLTVDGLASSALGCYGSPWSRTPFIDRLAADGIVFDSVFADSGDCGATLGSWLTGTHAAAGMPETSWLQSLKDSGYQIDLITDMSDVAQLPAREIATLHRIEVPEGVDAVPGDAEENTVTSRLFSRAAEVAAGLGPRRAVWLHVATMHQLWDVPIELRGDASDEEAPPPPETAEPPDVELAGEEDPDVVISWMQIYAAQVRLLDRCLERFCSIDYAAADKPPVIALAATSGMALGEHGWIGPGSGPLLSARTHLPLVLYDPLRPPTRVRDFFQPGDFADSFLEAVGAAAANASARPLASARPARPHPVSRGPCVTLGPGDERALRVGPWHFYALGGDRRLFLKPDDRHDFNDIALRLPDEVSQLADYCGACVQQLTARSTPPSPPEKLLAVPI